MSSAVAAPDVVVVGGGIAGLAAARRLADRGLQPLILERSARVGGRMTTDRVDGFAIDTGVTVLGNRFRGMRRLARRVGVPVAPVRFSLGVYDGGVMHAYRAQRPLDVLLDRNLSLRARVAGARVLARIAVAGTGMLHGRSDRAERFDRQTVDEYLSGLGAGGRELLARVFTAGFLTAALGGDLAACSRFVLMQVVWNTLAAGFWNVAGGVDRLPEAVARSVPVELGTEVHRVRATPGGVEVEASSAGSRRTVAARAAILAVPGHLVPELYPDAPEWLRAPAGRARFSRVASAHVALRRPPDSPHAVLAFAGRTDGVGVLELEHLRAPGRCPDGTGMVSVYFADVPGFACLEADDATLRARALETVARTFPGSAADALFVHLIRWPAGIAFFPKGRLVEVLRLRSALAQSDTPIDVAGDWLDGVASESALQMGEQAADRVAARLGRSWTVTGP